MSKKIIALAATLALFAILAAGCASTTVVDEPVVDETVTEDATEPGPVDSTVTIEGDEADAETVEEAADEADAEEADVEEEADTEEDATE